MKGDFTRSTFNARKHFTRVLMQQGRVQVDADWNEQQAILQHRDQTTAGDVIVDYHSVFDLTMAQYATFSALSRVQSVAHHGGRLDVLRGDRIVTLDFPKK